MFYFSSFHITDKSIRLYYLIMTADNVNTGRTAKNSAVYNGIHN